MELKDFNGFLNFKEETYPFAYKDKQLIIHPYSIKKWKELHREFIRKKFNNGKKWIDKLIIDGITDSDKNVKFYVDDNPSFYSGYYIFNINYMYIYDKYNSEEEKLIFGLNIRSNEINYFYDVGKYIKQDFELKENTFDKYTLEFQNKKSEDLGSFRFHNYSITINGGFSWKKENGTYGSLEINSVLIFIYSRPCNELEFNIQLINYLISMLQYLSYRKNISINSIETFCLTKDKLRKTNGNFYIFDEDRLFVESKENTMQIIDVNGMGKRFSKLFQLNVQNKLYKSHICRDSNDRHIYTPSRIIAILIAFENSFSTFYPSVKIKSEATEKIKAETILFLECKRKENTGNLKKKYQKMIKSISKLDVSYGEYLKYALNDNYNILKPFIIQIYDVKYPRRVINSASNRINNIRNKMAHGIMDIKFKPINTKDVHLVEILLYIIPLKKIGLEDNLICDKIKQLFSIRY